MLKAKHGYRAEYGYSKPHYVVMQVPKSYSPWRHTLKWRPEIENWQVTLLPQFVSQTLLPKKGNRRDDDIYVPIEFPTGYNPWIHILHWNEEFENWEVRYRNLKPMIGFKISNNRYEKVDFPLEYDCNKHVIKWNPEKEEWEFEDSFKTKTLERWKLNNTYFHLRYFIHNFETVQDYIDNCEEHPETLVVYENSNLNNDLINNI